MRNGRTAGVALGVGVIVGTVGIALLAKSAAAATLGSPREPREPPRPPAPSGRPSSYDDRHRSLVTRGRQGERWRDVIARTAPIGYADPAWVDAVVRWIGIESGGDPTNVTGGKELGLVQINRSYATGQGFTKDELDRYVGKATSDEDRGRTSWKYVRFLDAPQAKVGTPDVRSHAWAAYMRHALPLLLHELADQGFLADGPGGEKMNTAWELYRPSARAQAYATGTGTVGQRLLTRFVAAADVVAGYDRSARWTPTTVA